jgi:hypothetical protein
MHANSALSGRGGSQTAWGYGCPIPRNGSSIPCFQASSGECAQRRDALRQALSVVRAMSRIILYDYLAFQLEWIVIALNRTDVVAGLVSATAATLPSSPCGGG